MAFPPGFKPGTPKPPGPPKAPGAPGAPGKFNKGEQLAKAKALKSVSAKRKPTAPKGVEPEPDGDEGASNAT